MTPAAGGLRYFATVTRPRFWLYLAGPYLLGYTAGASSLRDLLAPEFWLYLAFFLGPANLLLYGVNDLADADTDAVNPKKGTMEARLDGRERPLARAVLVCLLVSGLAVAGLPSWPARGLLVLFVALALGYSLPPFRFKARPILDMASNFLYALPGFVGYLQAGGGRTQPTVVAFAWCWTAAMHLFSAIPDIASDRQAGVVTTATRLGAARSLALCGALWGVGGGLLLAGGVLWPWSLLALLYPAIPLVLLWRGGGGVGRAYWAFPLLNGALGMLAFFLIALTP